MGLLTRLKHASRYARFGFKKGAALHEAADTAGRLSTWTTSGSDINTILSSSGGELVRRSRDLVGTNGYARAARRSFVGNVIGTGIMPSSDVQDDDLRKQAQELWLQWCKEADADGQSRLYGMQSIAARSLFDAGELFIRFRSRRQNDGLLVPLQLQMLEPEYLDRTYNVQLSNGNQVKCGIEFNRIGRRVAYHFFRQHPGDGVSVVQNPTRTRVLARNVLHVYEVERPGQIRGMPMSIAALVKLHQLDKYDDAELMRKNIAALFAGFITDPDGLQGAPFANEGAPDSNNQAEAEWEPGLMQVLRPGQSVEFSNPADVGGNYEAFQFRVILAVSAALGVPYANVSSDYSDVNYSSQRAALLEFQRHLRQFQFDVIVHQFCRPVWERWVESAVLSGALSGDVVDLKSKVTWIPPKWEWVDPLKDRKAEKLAVDAAFKSRSAVIEAEGGDPDAVDERIRADQERAEKLGLSISEAAEGDLEDEKEEEKKPNPRRSLG